MYNFISCYFKIIISQIWCKYDIIRSVKIDKANFYLRKFFYFVSYYLSFSDCSIFPDNCS